MVIHRSEGRAVDWAAGGWHWRVAEWGVALFACFIVQQAGHKGPAIIEPCSGWPNRLKELLGMARALCRAGPGPVVVRVRLVSGKKT